MFFCFCNHIFDHCVCKIVILLIQTLGKDYIEMHSFAQAYIMGSLIVKRSVVFYSNLLEI